jgi:hypothetical protein
MMEGNRKAYYLSEMNLSDRHGGGLTLQRILGDEIDAFDNFIQIFEFPENFPTAKRFLPKEVNLWKDLPRFIHRKTPRRFSKDYFVIHLKRLFGIPLPDYRQYDFRNVHYHKELKNKLSFDKSKFLVVPQQVYSIYLTNFLYDKYKIKYAVWIMDDHVLRYSKEKGFHYPHPTTYESRFRKFLKNAKVVFVISPNMGDFYKNRFGVDGKVLFGPSDYQAEELNGQKVKASSATAITLCYFGALWKWQEDALERLIDILNRLDADLHIFSFSNASDKVRSHARVKIMEPVSSDAVMAIIRTYDGVVVPYGFADELKPLSVLNISTKLSECLASGIPTVLVGPEDGAMTRFAREYNCAIILSDFQNPEQIVSFKEAFKPERKEGLLKNARWVSDNITSTSAMRKVWNEGWQSKELSN